MYLTNLKICLLLFLSIIFSSLSSQVTQNGLVREFNSDKKTLTGVGIDFIGAVSTESDVDGKFVLEFSNSKKDGDAVSFVEATKPGYEIVNESDLHSLRFSSDGKLAADIILAEHGVIETARAEYAGVSLEAITENYEKERAELIKKVRSAEIQEEQYRDEINRLNEKHETVKGQLDALALTFARVNFDDVSPEYREALELFKSGQIKEAIAKLQDQNLSKQVNDLFREIERISGVESKLNDDKKRLEKRKKELIDMVSVLADMHSVDFNLNRAESLLDTLVLIDSSDLDILVKAANFYRVQHRYEKALALYSKIIIHQEAESWLIGNAYNHTGDLYTATGILDSALANYTKFYLAYYILFQEDGISFYKNGLATSYSKLGNTQSSLGNLEAALMYYEKFYALIKELYEAYPNDEIFKNGLAISYSKLGNTQTLLGNLSEALNYYEEYHALNKELYEAYPNNVDFKRSISISYSNLGDIHRDLGNLNESLGHYEKSLQLEKELFESYPNNVDFKDGLAINYQNLGNTHTSLGNLNMALDYYEKYYALKKELYEAYPNNVDFKRGLSISYSKLGEIHVSMENPKEAYDYFKEHNQLEKELHESHPRNIAFKHNLAVSYSFLGHIKVSMGNSIEALGCYEKLHELEKELFESHPDNKEFKNGLAISYYALATIYQQTDIDKSIENTTHALVLYRELIQISPQTVSFKSQHAFLLDYIEQLKEIKNGSKSSMIIQTIKKTNSIKERYQLYPSYVDALKNENSGDEKISLALNSQARCGLLTGHFSEAEQSIKEGINLFPENELLYTNLPPALLFQGKVDEANALYIKYANKPYGVATYKVAFLDDLTSFKQEGIIPEDLMDEVQEIIEMLEKM